MDSVFGDRQSVAVIFGLLYGATACGVVVYQGNMHNEILKKMFSESGLLIGFTVADVVIGLFILLFVYESHVTRARVERHQKRSPLARNDAALEDTNTLVDVVGPTVVWFVYTGVLVAKVALIFYGYVHSRPDLLVDSIVSDDVQWAILLTAGVFFVEICSNVSAVSAPDRDVFLVSGSFVVLMDLFDSTDILDLWFDDEYEEISSIASLRYAAAFFHCVSLLFPFFAIVQIMKSRYGISEMEKRFETCYTLLRAVTVNLPYLVLRCFAAHTQRSRDHHVKFQTKALIAKNVYAIVCAATEVQRKRRRM